MIAIDLVPSILRRDRFLAIRELIRYAAACSRGDYNGVTGLIESCYAAIEVEVPDAYLLPALVTLRRAVKDYGFGSGAFPAGFGKLLMQSGELAETNRKLLEGTARRLGDRSTREALLMGDYGVLAGLYCDLGAFLAERRTVGVAAQTRGGGAPAGGAELLWGPGGDSLLPLDGTTGPNLERWSKPAEVAGRPWKVPRKELVLTLLAVGVSDSVESPRGPAVWAHLALAAGGWAPEARLDEVVRLARELHLSRPVRRGLAIVRHLFPELAAWLKPHRFGLGSWELNFSVRLAARRSVARSVPA